MSTIRSTIVEALNDAGRGSYIAYAEPVIAALEEREDNIVRAIEAVASRKGLRESEVAGIMVEVGLVEPEPVVEATPEEPQSVEAMIASLAEQVSTLASRMETLVSAAARHGVNV